MKEKNKRYLVFCGSNNFKGGAKDLVFKTNNLDMAKSKIALFLLKNKDDKIKLYWGHVFDLKDSKIIFEDFLNQK
jgi:hypothetical protein